MRIGDGGVHRNCHFYRALEENQLNLPDPKPLPQSNDPVFIDQHQDPVPFVFVADDAFPLGIHCMKPFPQTALTQRKRVFNYRTSRKRRISENTFGIWVNRFRVFTTKMVLSPEKATIITLATLALHNMLRDISADTYTPDGFIDMETDDGEVQLGSWREESLIDFVLHDLPVNKSNRASASAEYVREVFADHFYGPGQVPWQWKMI